IADANRSKNVLLACCGEADLNKRLLALFRQARTSLQEGGSNVLFLAIGFLAWTDGPKERQAPLILVPVALSRGTAGSRFRLEALDDEPRFNLTLIEMLRTRHSIGALDAMAADLPRDDKGLDVALILDAASSAVSGLAGWKVTQRATLGLFSFAKHLMWKDLADIEAAGRDRSSEVLNLLINRVPLPEAPAPFAAPGELDDRLMPADEFLPLRADSSQLAAVVRAASGGSFVLIGPPGTGKSQTIANLVAQCVAEGKTVLFVAEKAAALNVVHRRLQAQGLGGFCLELHSNRTDKLAVVKRLHEEAASQPARDTGGWALDSKGIEKARGALNAYARAVHRQAPSGMTAFSALGGLLTRWGQPDSELGPPADGRGLLALERGAVEAMLEAAGRLGALGRASRGKGSLMRYLGAPGWSPEWEEGVCASAARLTAAAERLRGFEAGLGPLSPPGVALSPLALSGPLFGLAAFLPAAEGGALSFVSQGAASPERARLAEAARLLAEASAAMAAFRGDGAGEAAGLAGALDALAPLAPDVLSRGGFDLASVDRASVDFLLREALERPDLARPAWTLVASGGAGAVAAEASRALALLSEYGGAAAALEGSYDMDRALALDLAGLAALWDSAGKAFFVTAYLRRRKVRKALAAAMTGQGGPAPSRPREEIAALSKAGRASAALGALPALGALALAPGGTAAFKGRLTDPADFSRFSGALARMAAAKPALDACARAMAEAALKIKGVLAEADGVEAVMRSVPPGGDWAGMMSKAAGLMLEGRTPYGAAAERASGVPGGPGPSGEAGRSGASDGPGRPWAARVARAALDADSFKAEAAAFMGLLGWRGDLGRLSFGEAERAAWDALAYRDSLNACVQYARLKKDADALGLGPFAEALEKGEVPEGEEREALWRSICSRFVYQAVNADAKALGTTAADRGHQLGLLRKHYEAKLAGAVAHVRALRRGPGFADGLPKSELRLLEKEFGKKRRHLPVRRLLASLPELVPALTPCLLMSPQSVSQYLPADGEPFDLVVFDEASQIPSADAVGALARGRRAVVVGDPKQLPPTDFFQKRVEADEDSDEGDEEPLESILDDCLAAGFPKVSLGWHYRSRSESLISFSNGRYYGGGLVTFPSPDASGQAVSFVKVDGAYERGQGRTRTNPPEAEAAAAEALRLLRSPASREAGFSVAVVTFNQPQQELIENILERERLADPSLEPFFDDALEEPVIVKNLENIQGDERGHVIFSVGYGPDAKGKMSLNFGPLNKPGGERRLNVAITRARLGVKVFASFYPDAIPEGERVAKGVADLRDFMRYAARGGAAARGPGAGPAPSEFAGWVAGGLRGRGWKVDCCLGASGFKMDMAVIDPSDPSRYLAGVECDGESFRDAATAVDREILRGEVLAGLGWKIIRIWSMEWWKQSGISEAEARLDSLDAELRGLLK
ncbi:MAG: DUF4011 domain-containing protein, partial [Deltaproteobacteria bacterium]|nr:DUF4011 domain-containing protein [Deltaproteobacteria bacterium]